MQNHNLQNEWIFMIIGVAMTEKLKEKALKKALSGEIASDLTEEECIDHKHVCKQPAVLAGILREHGAKR
jgi:hypothetical protein